VEEWRFFLVRVINICIHEGGDCRVVQEMEDLVGVETAAVDSVTARSDSAVVVAVVAGLDAVTMVAVESTAVAGSASHEC
jgi:hypothetical protein